MGYLSSLEGKVVLFLSSGKPGNFLRHRLNGTTGKANIGPPHGAWTPVAEEAPFLGSKKVGKMLGMEMAIIMED